MKTLSMRVPAAPSETTKALSNWLLALLLLTSEALYLLLLRLDAINGLRPVSIFLAILSACFVLMLAAYFVLRNAPTGRLAWLLTIGGAVLFRVTLLPAGLPPHLSFSEKWSALKADCHGEAAYERFQLFDDDIWRYLWDGKVAASGRNPYSAAPAALDTLATPGSRPDWESIRENINYPEIRTVYPPLAQIVFRAAYSLAPGSVLAMKLIVVGFDLLAYGLVILTLAANKQHPARSILYGWNPLVIKVFAGSGHIDAVLVAMLAASCYFLARKRPIAASLSLGLAIAAKLAPIVLLPLLARRAGWRRAGLACAVALACFLPYLGAGTHLFDGLREFSARWQFNSGPFRLLAMALPDPAARIASAALVVIALAFVYRRDRGFPESAVLALGAVLMFSPMVAPWYATWLLPLGVIAWNRAAVFFSAAVCTAFLVMVQGVEWPWALALEYGSLGVMLWWQWRTENDRSTLCDASGGNGDSRCTG